MFSLNYLKFSLYFFNNQVLCYMPELTIPKSHRNKKRVKDFKRELYHRTLYDVLRPVRQAQKRGGFWAKLNGE